MTETEKSGLTVKIDWLNFSGPSSHLEAIKVIISDHLAAEPLLVEKGRHTYQRHYAWACGAILCFTDGRADCLLSMNGDAVDCIGDLNEQLRLLRQMHGNGFRTTRVDLAADDWDRAVTLDQVHQAAESCNFTGFRRTEARQPKRVNDGRLELAGDMRTFGLRGESGSGVYVRVYDKLLESGGEIDCIRWEVEHGQDKAHAVGRALADCEDVQQLARVIGAMITGAIDFRVRGTETHVDRRPRLSWWASMVERLGRVVVRIHRVTPPLQDAARAFAKQFGGTLAKLKIVCDQVGQDLVGCLVQLIDQRCETIDPRQLDARDTAVDLVEAFKLRSRASRGIFAPAIDCPI